MNKADSTERLKMIAMDPEDLGIVSAHCQDAVLKPSDLKFLAGEKRFIIGMNRFTWEKPQSGSQPERRRSVLHFERVEKVRAKGMKPGDETTVLSLLAIVFTPDQAPAGHIDLVFSGDAAIRLEVECIEAQLADMKAAWAARSVPSHPAD